MCPGHWLSGRAAIIRGGSSILNGSRPKESRYDGLKIWLKFLPSSMFAVPGRWLSGRLQQGRVNQADVNRVTLPEMTDWHMKWVLSQTNLYGVKTPTIKVKVLVNLNIFSLTQLCFHFFGRNFAIFNTFRAEPSKEKNWHPLLYFLFCTVQMKGGWISSWNLGRGRPHQNRQNGHHRHRASNCEARRLVSVSDSKAPNTNIRQGAPRQIYHNLNNCLVSFWCSSYFWIYILQH